MGKRLFIELLLVKKGVSSGYQEYIFNLLNYFHTHRNEILFEKVIIWCKESEKEAFDAYKDVFLIKGFEYSSYFKRLYLQTVLPIKEGLTKEDLLFYSGNTTGLIKRCKILLTVHDLLYKRKKWLPNRSMRIHREFYIPLSLRKADLVVAISKFTKNDILNYYPFAAGKIEVVYNSMDFNKFKHKEKPNENGQYFLAICSNAYHKNLQTVLKAFDKYCQKGGKNNFVFVGRISNSGLAYETYNSLTKDTRERIKIVSNISNEELGELYENAAAYVSASLFEGLGMPVVEAMSFNIPVILSDIPPHREVSFNKGLYFDAEDANGLAVFMEDLPSKKCDYANEIKMQFSEMNTSAKYVELINRLH